MGRTATPIRIAKESELVRNSGQMYAKVGQNVVMISKSADLS